MHKVIIIGAGPAGISAGIYLIRSGIDVIIIDNNNSSLLKTDFIENYYGFINPISGKELFNNGKKQFKRLGGVIIDDEVTNISFDSNLKVIGKVEYECEYLIIATGLSRLLPNIKGLYEGRHVSFCTLCDGFFYHNKKVAVLGSGLYALSEAKHLEGITSDITILSNGNECLNNYSINKKKIKEVKNNDNNIEIIYEDDSSECFDCLFIADGVAGANQLAKKIGIRINNNKIEVNDKRETIIPNIYAIGDCINGINQVAKAVNDGMVCALDIIRKKK